MPILAGLNIPTADAQRIINAMQNAYGAFIPVGASNALIIQISMIHWFMDLVGTYEAQQLIASQQQTYQTAYNAAATAMQTDITPTAVS